MDMGTCAGFKILTWTLGTIHSCCITSELYVKALHSVKLALLLVCKDEHWHWWQCADNDTGLATADGDDQVEMNQ